MNQTKTTPGNTGELILNKYPCEYFLITPYFLVKPIPEFLVPNNVPVFQKVRC